jgi:hypothetical protein
MASKLISFGFPQAILLWQPSDYLKKNLLDMNNYHLEKPRYRKQGPILQGI